MAGQNLLKINATMYFSSFIDLLHFVTLYHNMQERLLENATVILSENVIKVYHKIVQVFYNKMVLLY